MTEAENSRESRLRSVLKAVTYRVVGTLTTGLLAYAVTRDLRFSLTIGALEPLVKMAIYYLHERVWQQVPRGTMRRFLGSG